MKKENFNHLQNREKITYYNSVKCYGSEMICRFRILNYWKSEKNSGKVTSICTTTPLIDVKS